MAPATCVIRYQELDLTLTVRVEGRATMAVGVPVRRLGERAIERGTSRLLFDLRDCTHMDSTFLGTILTLKKALDRGRGDLTIVAPSTACSRILHQMGLGELLPTSDGPDLAGPWTELNVGGDDVALFRRNVVQAHEELAALPGKSGEQFKAVIRCMEQTEKPANPPE